MVLCFDIFKFKMLIKLIFAIVWELLTKSVLIRLSDKTQIYCNDKRS